MSSTSDYFQQISLDIKEQERVVAFRGIDVHMKTDGYEFIWVDGEGWPQCLKMSFALDGGKSYLAALKWVENPNGPPPEGSLLMSREEIAEELRKYEEVDPNWRTRS